jgi:hypothetical protein
MTPVSLASCLLVGSLLLQLFPPWCGTAKRIYQSWANVSVVPLDLQSCSLNKCLLFINLALLRYFIIIMIKGLIHEQTFAHIHTVCMQLRLALNLLCGPSWLWTLDPLDSGFLVLGAEITGVYYHAGFIWFCSTCTFVKIHNSITQN